MIEGPWEAAFFVWGRPLRASVQRLKGAPYAIGQILRTQNPSYRALATAIPALRVPALRCPRACLVV